MPSQASGVQWRNMLGNSWQPPESHNLLLFHGKAGCVFPGTVPPAALNHSLFVLTPFSFLDVSPIQHDARLLYEQTLLAAQSLPSGLQIPWPLGPAVCHISAHLCPTLWASACQDSPPQPSAGFQADLEGPLQEDASCVSSSVSRENRLPFSGLPWASGAFRHLSIYS